MAGGYRKKKSEASTFTAFLQGIGVSLNDHSLPRFGFLIGLSGKVAPGLPDMPAMYHGCGVRRSGKSKRQFT
jgi:hypothetical protein